MSMKRMLGLLLLTMPFLAVRVYAQAGNLDASFNATGMVQTSFGGTSNAGNDVLVQPDGRLVVVASRFNGSGADLVLVRYMPDGNLDATFGNGGLATTTQSFSGTAKGALQPDGKIVIGATANVPAHVFGAMRFYPDGTIDDSFGVAGLAVANIPGGGSESLEGIALQADGKILLGGYTQGGPDGDMAAARLLPDGTLDVSFANSGTLVLPVSANSDQVRAIQALTDGRILMVGGAFQGVVPNITSHMTVVCLLNDGTLDTSFGSNGVVILPISVGGDYAYACAVQSDSKILVTGYSGYPSTLTTVRLIEDGSLDSLFGLDGVITTSLAPINVKGKSVVQQPDGKVLVAAECWDDAYTELYSAVLRYTAAGVLDNTFGTAGISVLQSADWFSFPESIAIQDDGKILTCGAVMTGSSSASLLVRYLNDLDIGIVEFTQNPNPVMVHPNPLKDQTTLRYTLSRNERITITVRDESGRLIRSILSNVLRTQGTCEDQITLGDLPKGAYTLLISNGRACTSVRMMKD